MKKVTEQDIEKAWSDFRTFDRCIEDVCTKPTRTFDIGESVKVGNLDDCIIADVMPEYNGKIYRVDYKVSYDREALRAFKMKGEEPEDRRATRFDWWYEIRKEKHSNEGAPQMFADWLPGQVTATSFDSLYHIMSHDGIVCDPRYQREFVWNEENQTALIDSIFNRINIGSVVFSRHLGYHHEDSERPITYVNLDGDTITVPENKDYTSAVIDGQQRITTIWKFYTDQFKYRGRYFSELHYRDQFEFNQSQLSVRKFDEDDVPYKDVLRMFIMVNRGVPQDEEHLNNATEQWRNLQ